MKSLVAIFSILTIFYTVSAYSAEVNTSGIAAFELVELGNKYGLVSRAENGDIDLKLNLSGCHKNLGPRKDDNYIICFIEAQVGQEKKYVQISTDYVNGTGEDAKKLRNILAELTGNEKIISNGRNGEKKIEIKALKCDAKGIGHEFDSINAEPKYNCKITY